MNATTPPHHPNALLAHYRQLLITLLANVEAEIDEANLTFDPILRELQKLGNSLARLETEMESPTAKRLLAGIVSKLKAVTRLVKNARRHSQEASGSADQAHAEFLASQLSIIPEGVLPPSLGPEVNSVVLSQTILNKAGQVSKYEFLIDGFPYRFPRAPGRLLKALCEDRDGSSGRYIPFKSQPYLEKSLGVTSTWLHTQVNRLRNKLEREHGFPRALVETDRAEGYRVRLVRQGLNDPSERV